MPLKNRALRSRCTTTSVAALALLLALPGQALAAPDDAAEPAAAQAADSRVKTYDAAYFAPFSPNNALDMVRRVTGFQLEEGDNDGDVRGFSQAAGNVVFNGARPSSKSEGLDEILARIPASRVVRIEVGAGEIYGSDYAGKNQVLNLVLSEAGGIDGNVKASASRQFTGWVVPNLEASVLIKTGGSTINLSASTGRYGQVEKGYDDLTLLSDGSRFEYRDKTNRIEDLRPTFAAAWGQEGAGGRAAHLNLRYSPRHFNLKQENHITPASGPERDDRLEQISARPLTSWAAIWRGRWARG